MNAGGSASLAPAGRRPGARRLGPWLAMIAVLAAYAWVATLGEGRFDFHGTQRTLYTDLVEAFTAGQLHLKEPPNPALLRLADPYDPVQNGPYRYLDASLFRGQYFVYFGITPVLFWLWPYHAVTGLHPPASLTVFLFCSAAFLVGAGLIGRIRRLHFPEVGGAVQALCVLAWGLGNFYGVLLSHHDFFEIAVACGACCLLAMLFFLHVALVSPGGGAWALGAASACYGLAIGSRPNLVFTGVAFALVLGLRGWRERRWEGRLWCAAAAPAGIILAGLAWYNWMRFGDPREFGLHYQLTVSDRPHWAAFSWDYARFNAYYYLVSVPRFSAYFPFLVAPAAGGGTPPPGHEGVHDVVGSLWACPLLLCALAAGLRAGKHPRPGAEIRMFALILAATFAAVGSVLLGIGFSSYRYMGEMQGPLGLLAVVGGLAIASRLDRPWLRGGLGLLALGLVAWTAGINFLLSLDVEDMFRAASPERYRQVERALNRPADRLEEALGWHPRRPVITLRFPAGRAGTVEPLLVTGAAPASDFFYVYYTTPRQVQIGFESMGRGGAVSDLIAVDYAAIHTLEIEGGLFLPPPSHPWLERRAGGRAPVLARSLVVELDGRPVLDTYADFYPTKGQLSFGRSEADRAFGEKFTGLPFQVAWVPARINFADSRFARDRYGAVTLAVTFPAQPAASTEPLLTTGARNRAHVVTVTYLAGGRIRLGLRGSNRPEVVSAPLDLGPAGPARVKILLGSLYPTEDSPLWRGAPGSAAADLNRYRIEVNGRVVLEGKGDFYPAPPDTVAVGQNTAGFSGVTAAFGGQAALAARSW